MGSEPGRRRRWPRVVGYTLLGVLVVGQGVFWKVLGRLVTGPETDSREESPAEERSRQRRERAKREFDLGWERMGSGEYEAALDHFGRSVAVADDYPGVWYSIAIAKARLLEYQGALASLEEERGRGRVIECAVLLLEGECQEALGQAELAKRAYQRGAEIDPEDTENRTALGRLCLQTGDLVLGEGALREAYERIPTEDRSSFFEQGAIWFQDARAHAELARWVELHRTHVLDDPRSYLYSGVVAIETGDLLGAVEELELGRAASPEDPRPFEDRLAIARIRLGRTDDVIAWATALLEEDPRDLAGLYYRALAHARLAKYELALADLKALMKIDQDWLPRVESEPGFEALRSTEGYDRVARGG